MLIEEELTAAAERIAALELKVKSLDWELGVEKFRLCNIVNDNVKVAFYAGFPSYGALKHFTGTVCSLLIIYTTQVTRKVILSVQLQTTYVIKQPCLLLKNYSLLRYFYGWVSRSRILQIA